MSKSWHIGIDPGLSGAVCIMRQEPQTNLTYRTELEILKMPLVGKNLDLEELYDILEPFEGGNGILAFEKIGQIFGSSKATASSLGYQSGALEMACVALSIPYVTVPPKTWQKEVFVGIPEILKPSMSGKTQVRDTKKMALMAIKRLYPDLKLTFGDRAEKPHDGLIDAVLIAHWAKQKYK